MTGAEALSGGPPAGDPDLTSPGLEGSPDALRAAMGRLLLTLADTKRILGLRYSDWLLGAPAIEAGIAASSMAQDEWGHARLLYATLGDFGEDPRVLEHERDAANWTSLEVLDGPFEDWAQFVGRSLVVDAALAIALEGLKAGLYAPIDGRLAKMLAEEEFHRSLLEAWCTRLASGSTEARGRLGAAITGAFPAALRWVGPGDGPHARLREAGLTSGAPTLRAALVGRVRPFVRSLGLDLPGPASLDDDWDGTRARGAGQPDDDVVERARGDRNRALFVE
ncbi:MAG: hypothetical protein EA352_08680 [Gemmatimonadales bacterium]|nr:MAG: hypothetical protein EA352_08680 [Gemmatimonadales bacterium]